MAKRIPRLTAPLISHKIDPIQFQEICQRHTKNTAFISLDEASAITKEYTRKGYSKSTLYKARHYGALQARKLGRDVYMDWSQLLSFLEKKIK